MTYCRDSDDGEFYSGYFQGEYWISSPELEGSQGSEGFCGKFTDGGFSYSEIVVFCLIFFSILILFNESECLTSCIHTTFIQ